MLYGSKVLTPWLWFGSDEYYTGIVNANESGFVTTDKYYVIKNTLTPRLSGLMGQVLRKARSLDQDPEIQFGTTYKFIQQIVNTYSCTMQMTDGSGDAFDLGFFTDSLGRDYFMLISRYYNSECNPTLRIYFNPYYFQPYRNLNLKNFITGGSTTKTINQYLSVLMDKGDAVFYGVFPVVKYGGDLIANDTIKTNTELIEDMWIKNNVNLIIERGKYYTIKDTVTLEGTGFITGKGYLNIGQGGDIKITNWNKSVFKGREANHPKIIWGRYPTNGRVTSYKIYRAKGNNQFIQIANVD